MIPDSVLLAYLDESLAADRMAHIEQAVRDDATLRQRIMYLVSQRDSGVHSLGDIWRRNRLSCPTREQLGSYLLGAMLDDAIDYVRFHVDVVGCRYCCANLEDLRASRSEPKVLERRNRIFQSSVGRVQSNRMEGER